MYFLLLLWLPLYCSSVYVRPFHLSLSAYKGALVLPTCFTHSLLHKSGLFQLCTVVIQRGERKQNFIGSRDEAVHYRGNQLRNQMKLYFLDKIWKLKIKQQIDQTDRTALCSKTYKSLIIIAFKSASTMFLT